MHKAKKSKENSLKTKSIAISTKEYVQTLIELKNEIREAQIRATAAANQELIKLYWKIGEIIVDRQVKSGWGTGLIEKLTDDLQKEFPGIGGFSRSNIFRMRAFYLAYSKVAPLVRQFNEIEKLTVMAQIPWSHNVVLMEKLENIEERIWYAHKTIENGWSRNILAMQIDAGLYRRQGKAVTNFSRTLAATQSDLAQQSLKDPYLFNFLTLDNTRFEKDIEQGLVDNIQKLLLELGKGFAFVDRQYHFEVGGRDYYLDLLFYHTKLHCYVVIELKTGEFDPCDAGQISFYLSAVDNLLRSPDDKPTIGLILCKTKNNITVEYALQEINKPIGVAAYTTKIFEKLPKEFKSSLPTIEEIEAELEKQSLLGTKKQLLLEKKRKK